MKSSAMFNIFYRISFFKKKELTIVVTVTIRQLKIRGIRYTPKPKRFDYPTYLDPYQWGGVYDGTQVFINLLIIYSISRNWWCRNKFKYGNICLTGSANEGNEDCLFLNILEDVEGATLTHVVPWHINRHCVRASDSLMHMAIVR